MIPKLQLLKKQGSAGCGKGLRTTRSTRKIAHNVTPSVVALRLLHLQRSSSLTLLVEGAPTTQEAETTSGFGHEGHLQACNEITLLVEFGGADDFPTPPEFFRSLRRLGVKYVSWLRVGRGREGASGYTAPAA